MISNITNTDRINYDGSVVINLTYKNGKTKEYKKHNAGQLPLFNAVAKLLGSWDVTDVLPELIDLGATSQGVFQSFLTAPANKSTTCKLYKKIDTTYEYHADGADCDTVQYQFTIPKTLFRETGQTVTTLQLKNQSGAVCADVTDLSISLTGVSNVTVYWRLHIS